MPASASGFADIGSAASSIFSGIGELQSAKGYKKAAGFAGLNADISQQSADIQELMASRQVYKTMGGQQADVAGAGLASSGSALDLMRDSAQQGSLTKQLIANQGEINVMGYKAEEASYSSMASAAKASGIGGIVGGVIKGAAALMAFSDDRLKQAVVKVDTRRDGLGIYEFNYNGSAQRFRGVLASEVQALYPDAVTWDDGFRVVNYSKIGVTPEVV